MQEALRALDPARLAGADETPSQAQARLEAIVGTPRPALATRTRDRRSRRWVLAGVSVAASVAIGLVVADPFGSTAQPAYAVTPRPLSYQPADRPADQVLEEIALRIASLPDDRPATWSVERFVQESWSLATRIDGLQVTSAVLPEYRVTWQKPDGSSRWTVKTLPPQFQNTEQRKTWEAAGAVGETPEKSSGSAPSTKSAGEPPSTPGACRNGWPRGRLH